MPIQYETPAKAIGFLPEEQRNTAYYLFSRAERYNVRIKLMDTRSMEHIRFFGTPTASDPDYDREMRNELVVRRLTIAEMACYFREGVTIAVIDRADTKTIYERITDHLIAWRDALQMLNHPQAPIEDLITLDEFAHKVYEHARWHFKDPYTTSLLERAINARFGGGSLLGMGNSHLPTPDSPPPARDTFNDLFIGHRPAAAPSRLSLNGASPNPFHESHSDKGLSSGFAGNSDTNDAMQFDKRFGAHRR
jgi:hypothetical protein